MRAAQRIQRQGDLCESDVISHWRDRMRCCAPQQCPGRQGISASAILSYEGIRGEDDGDHLDSCERHDRRVVGGAIINPRRIDVRYSRGRARARDPEPFSVLVLFSPDLLALTSAAMLFEPPHEELSDEEILDGQAGNRIGGGRPEPDEPLVRFAREQPVTLAVISLGIGF